MFSTNACTLAHLATLLLLFVTSDCQRIKKKNPADCCTNGQKKAAFILIEPVTCQPPSELWQSYNTKMDEIFCQAFYTSCCKVTAEVQFCDFGRRMAMVNQLCLSSSKIGGSKQNECCECCKRGQRAAKERGKCDTSEEGYCGNSFKICCKNILEKLPVTTAPPKKTCANTCDPKSTKACEETSNGPRCKCKDGFAPKNDGVTCLDINECASPDTNRCPNSCVNVAGSYSCECEGNLILKDGACIEKVKCGKGYVEKGGQCLDIDECATKIHRCSKSSYCVNEPGDYRCQSSCKAPFFRINPKNGNCEDVDECTTGTHSCSQYHKCINLIGSYDCERTSCQEGFKFVNGFCEDVDECAINENICGDKEKGKCVNKDGTYTCACQVGYEIKNGKCEDIDECKLSRAFCQHKCVNTQASYRCDCPPGYEVSKKYCYDIDECENSSLCGGKFCANGYGHYYCIDDSCPAPYFKKTQLHKKSPMSCVKKDCAGDKKCADDPLQSIKRIYYTYTNVVDERGFQFTYTLGFSLDFYLFKVTLIQDDPGNYFKKDHIAVNKVQIVNSKKIIGPKTFHLIMKTAVSTKQGDVNTRVTWNYEYHFHIRVSQYGF